jgi:hypothetical protein
LLESAPVRLRVGALLGTHLESSQSNGKVALQARAALGNLCDQRFDLSHETSRGQRRRLVFVKDSTSGGLERGRHCIRCLNDVLIEELLKRIAAVPQDKRGYRQKPTRLALRQPLKQWKHLQAIVLLLTLRDRWRMAPRRHQINAVGGTRDLDEAFRAAANSADLLPERRTGTLGFPLITEGA